jgi:hypothetical protein
MYFTILDSLSADASVLARGLTAYNHNLDTSREYYPKVGLREYLPMLASLYCAGHHYKNIR